MAKIKQALLLISMALLAACNYPTGSALAPGESPHAVGNGQTPSLQSPPSGQERASIRHAALEFDTLPAKKAQENKATSTDASKANKEAKGSLTGNDLGFIQRIGNDTQSLEQAALYVAGKTQNNDIRNYAAKVGRDHGTASEELRKLAAKRRVEIPSEPVGQLHAKLDQLRQLTGSKMDQAFLRDFAVQAHMDLITLFELQANQSGDKDLREFASKRLAPLHEYYEQGKALKEKHTQLTAKLHI